MRQVWPWAEINEVSHPVDARLPYHLVLDYLYLERILAEHIECLFFAELQALKSMLRLDDTSNELLQVFEVRIADDIFQPEVVEEAIIGRWAISQKRFFVVQFDGIAKDVGR